MTIRSMTGFAQVKGQANGQLGFALSLKSVNHRFLDLHFRMPSDTDGLEMKLRRLVKEKIARGHVELTLTLERAANETMTLNKEMVSAYIQAFRTAAAEFSLAAEPDLNVILRTPGALENSAPAHNEELEGAVLAKSGEAFAQLNRMREEEGQSIERELQERMEKIRVAAADVAQYRQVILQSYLAKLKARMQELAGSQVDPDRILQEAALLVDRSDIQEELVRLNAHIQHFLGLLHENGEVGKKLDFLLQEMNREANTLLSKTSGLAGEALKITEMGLAIKSEIEKAREQVQNVE